MSLPTNHFKPDGTCDCPMDGTCIECGRPCNDHDLVADWHWCAACNIHAWETDPALNGSNTSNTPINDISEGW